MEVPGRVKQDDDETSHQGPKVTPKLLCYPCLQDGSSVEAAGYCVDCEHHLCDGCYGIHCRPIPTRKHRLLDKKHMPKEDHERRVHDVLEDKCTKHTTEILQFYCDDHIVLACNICMMLEHRACRVSHVPTDSKGVTVSPEYKTFKDKITMLKKRVTETKRDAQENITLTKGIAETVLAEINDLRHKINDVLDSLEREIKEEITEIQARDEEVMSDIVKNSDDLLGKLETMIDDFQQKEERGQECLLYVKLKQSDMEVGHLGNQVEDLLKTNTIKGYDFVPNDFVKQFVENATVKLGKLAIYSGYDARVDIVDNDELNATAPLDKETPRIAGIVALPEQKRLVVTDWTNRSVKLIDITNNEAICHVQMKNEPWGITRIAPKEVAITQPSTSVISVMEVDNHHLSTVRENPVDRWCYGICYGGNKLVISHMTSFRVSKPSNNYVSIISMVGTVLKTLVAYEDSTKLFTTPLFVAFSLDFSLIYVTDMNDNHVICLTLDGKPVAFYKDDTLKAPEGLSVARDGTVFVCSYGSGEIHALSPELSKKKVYSFESIRKPEGLAFCDVDGKLYVGMADRKTVKVLSCVR